MNKISLNEFILVSKQAIYNAGKFALDNQDKVKDIGKKIENFDGDSDLIKKKRSAKTIIDIKIQEQLLITISKAFDTKDICVDCEEESKYKDKFASNNKSIYSLVLDPIDSTLGYLLGKDYYSVNIGLVSEGKILSAFVYYPKRNDLYYLDENGTPILEKDNKKIILNPKKNFPSTVFRNHRINKEIESCIEKKGYTIATDPQDEFSEALIKCIQGKYQACLFNTPQIRDVLLGALIEKMANGFAIDSLGKKLIWPNGGRIPFVAFGFYKESLNFLECLNL